MSEILNDISDIPFICKTTFGKFKIAINKSKSLDFMTRKEIINSYTINVGAINECVQIKIINNKSINTAELLIVKTSKGGCEIDGIQIKKESTVKMVLLAFTILQEKFPHITSIKLQDMSSFECTFENGSKSGISLTLYEILFHQQSWYHRRFNAKLINEDLYNTYIQAISKNFTDKLLKPEYFDFNNAVLNEMLTPIYKTSDTWYIFLNKVYKLNRLCEVIFPWYKYTSAILLNNINLDNQWWIINLKNNDKIYNIEYIIENIKGGNRKNKNNKTKKNIKYTTDYEINEPTYNEMYNYKYNNINFKILYK
jgi:hypothetical protein